MNLNGLVRLLRELAGAPNRDTVMVGSLPCHPWRARSPSLQGGLAGWLNPAHQERLERLETVVAVGQNKRSDGTYANTDPEGGSPHLPTALVGPDTSHPGGSAAIGMPTTVRPWLWLAPPLERISTEIATCKSTDVLEVEEKLLPRARKRKLGMPALSVTPIRQRADQRPGARAAQAKTWAALKRGPSGMTREHQPQLVEANECCRLFRHPSTHGCARMTDSDTGLGVLSGQHAGANLNF